MTVTLGRGNVSGSTNSPGGGHAWGRKITPSVNINITQVGFRYTDINPAGGTTKFRAAVYSHLSSHPDVPLAYSNEFTIASSAVEADYVFDLITPVLVSSGTSFYVIIFQSDNTHVTVRLADLLNPGTDSADNIGYYEAGAVASTLPDNPWVGTNTAANTTWMVWAVGSVTYPLSVAAGSFTLTGKAVTWAHSIIAGMGRFHLAGFMNAFQRLFGRRVGPFPPVHDTVSSLQRTRTDPDKLW